MKKTFINNIKISIVLLLVLVVSSCKKYLDEQPITSFGTDFVFNSVPNAYQVFAF